MNERDQFILHHVPHRHENPPHWRRVPNTEMIRDLDKVLAEQWHLAIQELSTAQNMSDVTGLVQSWLVRAHQLSPDTFPQSAYDQHSREIL